MCCEKCTAGGLATDYGRTLYYNLPEDERWHISMLCPMMSDTKTAKKEIMWGICRSTSKLGNVECCKKCEFFS